MRRELTDDERDSYAEHFYGYGPLPGIGARDPEPEDDDPRCEWCDSPPVDGEYAYAPYCSEDCEREASQDRETYSSVHPRPEEVG
jgi:hypothetical protein